MTLTLEQVTYRYPGAPRPALREVELALAATEVVGLVGAGESGKTTLCLVASGLAPRSVGGTLTGRLLIDGEDTSAQPIHALAARVGICFQNPHTQLSQVSDTVFEEVAFGPMNLGLDRLDVAARAEASLTALGIAELAERDPLRLSGGQMQLVAVAGLLAMSPDHLVLDEPTAQLDPQGKQLVVDALARLSAQGTTMLIAEHDTDLLARLCSRVIVIADGRIVAGGATRDVLADERLVDWGVEPPDRVRLARRLAAASISRELPK